MKILKCLAVALLATVGTQIYAEDVYATRRANWLQIAEECKPRLNETIVHPVTAVKAVNDANAFQGWRYEPCAGLETLYTSSFKDVGSITVDFGRHLTGYYTFTPVTLSRCQDAPVRLKFTFAELPAELNTPYDPWDANLSRAWMQDEVITVTEMDKPITIDRRIAGRYMRIDLLGASPDFDFGIGDMYFTALSSAGRSQSSLSADCPAIIKDIHDIGVETLRECMQTVYEDGPKRDHRLWIGDMYLESLANRYSFRNFDLTKRCLYLFAGLSTDDGILISNVFEHPEPHPQVGSYCLTYCLLFNSTLLEYLKDTGDRETADDLWDVARRQVEDALSYVGDDGIFNQNARNRWVWLFFDWRDGLDTNTPMQGATIFAINETYELAKMLGREKEVAHWPAIAAKMKKAARKNLYDAKNGVMVSGPDAQVSILSQAWAIRSGILSAAEGKKALTQALASDATVRPGTPYATHYLVDAMLACGMENEARDYLTDYWGGMVKKGADTFWEAYDPNDDFISPYRFHPVNSACHAWSCTPVYFINKYPEVFQAATTSR